MFALIGLLLLAVAALSLFAGAYLGVVRTLPSLQLVDGIASPETTRIYDASPTPALLAELHGLDSHDVLSADQIPKVARDAVVAADDPEFYQHKGMDFIAIVRAAWANFRHHKVPAGGSAITQGLIKNGVLSDRQPSGDAALEPALAYQLESHWTKEKILDAYLNVVYFGSGAYGIESASRAYFGVDAKNLTLAQAALLAGLPSAPSAYSPRRDLEAALARRNDVLNKMYQQHYISSAELQEALAAPVQLSDPAADEAVKEPYWVELVREQLVARYGSSTVLGGGLRVYTTLDPMAQEAADTAVATVLGEHDASTGAAGSASSRKRSAALVAINAHTGELIAMVNVAGSTGSRINLATQGRFRPGLTFLPVTLTAALEHNISPDAEYDPGDGTFVTLTQALAGQAEPVFSRIGSEVGQQALATAASELGISSPLGQQTPASLAVSGPTAGVTPLELAMAWATLASGGERLNARVDFDPSKSGYPLSISKVTTRDGRLLDSNGLAGTRALDRGLAELATSSLRTGMTSPAAQAAVIGRPAAGLGAVVDGSDSWFVGYTPDLVCAVWVGYTADNGPGGVSSAVDAGTLDTSSAADASALPAQIWSDFMNAASAGRPAAEFSTTFAAQWVSVDVCSESHLLPTDLCPIVVKRLFRTGEAPTDTCDLHVPQAVFMPDVVGMSVTRAKKVLADANLKVKTVSDATSLQPAGVVTKQDKPADKPILQGTTVVLHVSAGQGTTVPKLVDLTSDAAQAALAAQGLVAGITQTPSDTVPIGKVISQSPKSGATVLKGSTVHIVVSSGPATPPST